MAEPRSPSLWGASSFGGVLRRFFLACGLVALATAAVAAPHAALAAAGRTWSPFMLVAGLLLIGGVAHEEGSFERAASAIARLRGGPSILLLASLALVATVTALLNLDTAAAFLTPVLILSARSRRVAEAPFVLGSLVMANAASLLLPGSNLTNLLVLGPDHLSGAAFAARMLPAWLAAVAVTAAVVLVYGRLVTRAEEAGRPAPLLPLPDSDPVQPARPQTAGPQPAGPQPAAPAGPQTAGPQTAAPPATTRVRRGGRVGLAAAVMAGVAMVALREAAIPVAAIGVTAAAVRLAQRRLDWRRIQGTVDVAVLVGLFSVATALWTLATTWSGPAHLLSRLSGWETAAAGALASVVLNNLPAAALLGSHSVAHPRALLLGLDLGPNLAITGSLSALLWFQAARQVGVRPSLTLVSKVGIVLVPLSILAASLALRL
ncbi:MAG: SLC13 family permease [Acidimicrobiales bacterium]